MNCTINQNEKIYDWLVPWNVIVNYNPLECHNGC